MEKSFLECRCPGHDGQTAAFRRTDACGLWRAVANDMTTANSRHTGPEAMTPLANKDARLIGALHGTSPFDVK